ncbi:MAG: response regulator [Pseudomonadota bacterium]
MSSDRENSAPPSGDVSVLQAEPSTGNPVAENHESLLANVGHELRTPMNSILGFADLLMDMDLTEEQLSYVKLLRQSGSQLLSMINNILDYSKAAASRIEIDAIDFDLRVLVEDVAFSLAIQAEQKGIELACHVDADVPCQVVADPQYLRQILNNLAGNAIKFTNAGEVVIEVKMPTGEARGDAGHAILEVSVSDTGMGIAPDRHALIFERFTQADPTIARQFGGTGLGLTISKQLVQLMGGDIHVDSVPGKGSRFWFSLPVGISAETGKTTRPDRRDITGLRILVADANATYRRILMKILMNFGCSPVAVGSGAATLDVLERRLTKGRPFDLLIMDLTLPDMDGVSLMEAIGARSEMKDLRLIVLTSMTQRRQARQLAALGCHGYLTKPVRENLLGDVIREVVSRGDAPEAAGPLVTRHSVAERKFKGIRVLLAEDNHINAQLFRKVLTNSGYSVVIVSDGEKAVRAIERETFDLVLMDVQMPRLDGRTATRQIRAMAAGGARVPIVGLTASSLKSDCEACLAAGMDAVASKPIHPRDLIEMVSDILTRNGGAPPVCTPAPAAVPSPVDVVQALERALGDRSFLRELMDVFVRSVDDQLLALDVALTAGRLDTALEIAHKLKGSSGNLCATGIHGLARQMEAAALDGRNADAWRLLAVLKQEAGRLKAFVAGEDWID